MKRNLWIAICIFLAVSAAGLYTLVNVKGDKKQPPVIDAAQRLVNVKGDKEQPPVIDAAQRQLWQSEVGYNYILEMDSKSVILYSYTKDSLLPFGQGHVEEDGDIYMNIIYGNTKSLEGKDIRLGRFNNGRLTDNLGFVNRFKRIDHLPEVTFKGFSKDPVDNFEVFWKTFEENFSFFPIVKVDWKAVYKEYKPKVNAATSDKELEQIFKEMLGKLNDGHTNLIIGEEFFSTKTVEREEFYKANQESMQNNIETEYIKGALKSKLDGSILYGRTKSGDAYIKLIHFNVSDAQQIDEALSEMVTDLADCRNFIIDMRFNGGGDDFYGLKLAGLFTDERKLAYFKQVRTGGYREFSEPFPIYIEPGRQRLTADNIVVLTGPLTASAAETGTMALKELDRATVIGEKTFGVFSNMLLNLLPNKWLVTLSNELYTSTEGINYEQLGLPPDEELLIKRADIDAHKDPVLIRAMELLKAAP
ncbi:hypothetical protein GCM10010912_25130 [Paenibacillus albidus]|uniref:Tail specific protease domain-containing protein n=1 Tax=Paenibacillus albidus TaxID=2041023 RepID=A0A917FGY8_9BACL|nr:S41 family peptidase [Paenibacillus albidus]GGF79053.1 hypothetical protein GCM10010912_25130 [Paenibacillus albidus]